MMRRRLVTIVVLALVAALGLGLIAGWMLFAREGAPFAKESAIAETSGHGQMDAHGEIDATYQPTQSEIEAIEMALDDEYRARAAYAQALTDFGPETHPFANIHAAEGRHIDALLSLFDAYELEGPADPWAGAMPSYDSVEAACAAGVQSEIDNAALYDQLFEMVDNADIIRIFTALQAASQERHLKAFERCAGTAPA